MAGKDRRGCEQAPPPRGRFDDPQSPLPPEPPARRAARHLAWLGENVAALAQRARFAYRLDGRGALVVAMTPHPGDVPEVGYLSDAAVGHSPEAVTRAGTVHGWPDAITARLVHTYDPETEALVVIVDDGQPSVYRIPLP